MMNDIRIDKKQQLYIIKKIINIANIFSSKSVNARDKKYYHGGFIDRQHKGGGVGEDENRLFIFLPCTPHSLSLACSPMFSKRTKRKIKQHLCTG